MIALAVAASGRSTLPPEPLRFFRGGDEFYVEAMASAARELPGATRGPHALRLALATAGFSPDAIERHAARVAEILDVPLGAPATGGAR